MSVAEIILLIVFGGCALGLSCFLVETFARWKKEMDEDETSEKEEE